MTEIRPFRWDSRRERAAQEVAEDRITDEQIAMNAGVSRKTLAEWKKHPDFATRVEEHIDAYRKIVRERGIGSVDRRVAALDDRWRRMAQVIEARAAGMAGACEGGETGLLVRQTKFVKVFVPTKAAQKALDSGQKRIDDLSDDDFFPTKEQRPVTEYAVDTGLLAELRSHEKQAAQELGQWVDRQKIDVGSLTNEQIIELLGGGESAAGRAGEADRGGEEAGDLRSGD